ncbi:lipoate protein ligase C-terminal domain-containing protein [Escherichia coli]
MELHFDVEKGHITRAQVFTDSLNPAPLEALAGRLQGCLYRADMLQQECEACWLTSGPGKRATGVVDVDSGGGKVITR